MNFRVTPTNFATSSRITELLGPCRAEAFGVAVRAYAPLCAIARRLIRAGLDPGLPIEAYRGDVLALRGRSLLEVAQLTVQDSSTGPPRFRWHRPLSWEVGRAIEKNASGMPTQHPDPKNAPANTLLFKAAP
jgi:hypothetical protein